MASVPAPADRVIAAKLPNDLIARLREAAREADRTLAPLQNCRRHMALEQSVQRERIQAETQEGLSCKWQ